MLDEFDEYDDLIRSRMQMIDAEEYSGASFLAGNSIGAEEGMIDGLGSGEDDNIVVEKSYGAEGNVDSEDAGDNNSSEGGESGQAAA